MKTIKYGNIKKSGNTLYAKVFRDMDKISCVECGQDTDGFSILRREDLGSSIPVTEYSNIIQYTLECVQCTCMFTVTMEETKDIS